MARKLGVFLCRIGYHKMPGPYKIVKGAIVSTGGWGYSHGPCGRCKEDVCVWLY